MPLATSWRFPGSSSPAWSGSESPLTACGATFRHGAAISSISESPSSTTPREARTEDMLVDESASAMVRQLGDALTDIEVNGHVFGNCSLTLVLHGEDP